MRPSLVAVLFGLSMASCTAILGDVPTTGGSGGAGGAGATSGGGSPSPGASTSGPGSGGSNGVAGSGGAGGTPSTNPSAGGGGAGGGISCTPLDGACQGQGNACCAGLTCGILGRCTNPSSATSSSSTGGGNCTRCASVLEDGASPANFCNGSKTLWTELSMCACSSCSNCMSACQGGSLTADCENCALTNCMPEYDACKNDMGP